VSDTCPALFHEFLAETGLRFGEAQEVRWGDLDLGTRRLHVERRFYRGGVALPKGRKKRWVRLIEPMAAGPLDAPQRDESGGGGSLEPVETEPPALAEVTTG